MCGICGIIDPRAQKESTRKTVEQMNEALFHRGPDEGGSYSDDQCALAMRRLAIIDLSTGTQPIFSQDGNLCIFMNGEIYNFRELRSDLEKKGHQFHTNSDTEVVLQLYQAVGKATPEFLKGMFAFCIYDKRERSWFFARDRFGEKPFFYTYRNGRFTFSSELFSLLEDENVERILDEESLGYYLTTTLVPEPRTLFKGIKALPQGHWMFFQNGEITIRSYFKVGKRNGVVLKNVDECVEHIRPYLRNAVKRQLVSDVPVGAFLSGGIDSSTVVCHMQELRDQPVQTFTVKFDEAGYDESPIAREVAEKMGTDHCEIRIPTTEFTEDLFWMILRHVGHPFADSSAIPSYFITREIRKFVTVALSGDGGDEVFAGYPTYSWWQQIDRLKQWPELMQLSLRGAAGIIHNFPWAKSQRLTRRIRKATDISLGQEGRIGIGIHRMYSKVDLEKLLIRKPDWNLSEMADEEKEKSDALTRALAYRIRHNLPLDMLTKVDRMSMANSLEVRAPFLDPDLYEAAAAIPSQFLMMQGQGKYIIRKLMEEKLPASVFNHPKTGFSIPLHRYMNDAFQKLATEHTVRHPLMRSLFKQKAVQEVIRRGISQKGDGSSSVYQSSHQLWSLMQLGGWMTYYNISDAS